MQRSFCIVKDDLLKEDEGLRKLARLLFPFSNNLRLIATNYNGPINFEEQSATPPPNKTRPLFTYNELMNPIFRQTRIGIDLAKLRPKPDFVVFFTGTSSMAFVTVIARIFGVKTVKIITGDIKMTTRDQDGNRRLILPFMINSMKRMMLRLVDMIVIESPSVSKHYSYLNEGGVRKKPRRVIPPYIEVDKFHCTILPSEREMIVGYVGRLSTEKGVMNLAKAMPGVINRRKDIKFVLIGNGPLDGDIKRLVKANGLEGFVEFIGWANHDQIPDYLNKFKLMAMPSFSEGLPNVLLEAMACRTPVLATPVGGIQDLIVDEDTGFLLKDNAPDTIADGIIRALEHPRLEQIGANGQGMVVGQFSYASSSEKWRGVLTEMMEEGALN
jgi:glycosyltransferase involved in cell wall biosynthesis